MHKKMREEERNVWFEFDDSGLFLCSLITEAMWEEFFSYAKIVNSVVRKKYIFRKCLQRNEQVVQDSESTESLALNNLQSLIRHKIKPRSNSSPLLYRCYCFGRKDSSGDCMAVSIISRILMNKNLYSAWNQTRKLFVPLKIALFNKFGPF